MKKMELTLDHFCAIIFHNFWCELSRQECFDELSSLYSDEALFYSTIKNWYNKFKCGQCSTKDEFRAGCPKSNTVSENIDAMWELIKQDCHETYHKIEVSLDISMTSINKILHAHLAVKNYFSHWIPNNLSKCSKEDLCQLVQGNDDIQGASKAVYNIYIGGESCI